MNEDMVDKNNTIKQSSLIGNTEGKYLTFLTDMQLFAIPIADVEQIISITEITPVPDFPNYAKGIIHMRGSIIPIIDIRIRFNKPEAEYTDRTCIIVTAIGDRRIGFIVEGVDEVADIDSDEISSPPQVSSENSDSYLTGIAKHQDKLVLLLAIDKIISEKQLILLDNH